MAYLPAHSVLLSAGSTCDISAGQAVEPVVVTISDSNDIEDADCNDYDFVNDHSYLSHDARKDNTGWERAEVLLLISQYQRHKIDFQDRKKKKKDVWQQISEAMAAHGHLRNAADCETKFKGLKRTYNKHRQHRRKSGRDRKDWPFFKEMDDLLSSSVEYCTPVVSSQVVRPSTSGAQVLLSSSPQCSSQAQSYPGPNVSMEEDNTTVAEGDVPQQPSVTRAKAPKRRRPITVLQNIFVNLQAWQDEERRRYKQQLKMQRTKLRLLKRLTENLG